MIEIPWVLIGMAAWCITSIIVGLFLAAWLRSLEENDQCDH